MSSLRHGHFIIRDFQPRLGSGTANTMGDVFTTLNALLCLFQCPYIPVSTWGDLTAKAQHTNPIAASSEGFLDFWSVCLVRLILATWFCSAQLPYSSSLWSFYLPGTMMACNGFCPRLLLLPGSAVLEVGIIPLPHHPTSAMNWPTWWSTCWWLDLNRRLQSTFGTVDKCLLKMDFC
jgi:hypothetical protein